MSSKEKLLACFPAFDTLEDLLDTTDLIQLPDLLLTRPKALVNSLKHSLNYKFLLKQKQTKEGGGGIPDFLVNFQNRRVNFHLNLLGVSEHINLPQILRIST